MSRFSAYLYEPLTGDRIAEVSTWQECTYTRGLWGVGSGSLTLPWYDSAAVQAEPLTAALAVDQGRLLKWAGPVVGREFSPEQGLVRVGCQNWWWYYNRRWIRSTLGMTHAEATDVGPYDVKFIDVDQFDIVDDLITHAAAVAADADMGLTVRMYGPGVGGISDVVRTRDYFGYERKRIAQSIEELASQSGGFDFVVTDEWDQGSEPWIPRRYLDLYYPRAGESSSTLVLEHGSNVSMLRMFDDGERMANPITVAGAGIGDAAIAVEAVDTSLLYPAGPYPWLENDRQYRDEGTEYAGNLERLAISELAVSRIPLRTIEVSITEQEDGGISLGDIGIGDSVSVVANVGDFHLDDRMRVISETVTLSPEGLKNWKVSLVADDATLGIV